MYIYIYIYMVYICIYIYSKINVNQSLTVHRKGHSECAMYKVWLGYFMIQHCLRGFQHDGQSRMMKGKIDKV